MSVESNYARVLMQSMNKLEPPKDYAGDYIRQTSNLFGHYGSQQQRDYASTVLDNVHRDVNPVQSRLLRDQYDVPSIISEIQDPQYSPLELVE